MFISIITFNLNKFFPINKKINLENRIPFECGFNPISKKFHLNVDLSKIYITIFNIFLFFFKSDYYF